MHLLWAVTSEVCVNLSHGVCLSFISAQPQSRWCVYMKSELPSLCDTSWLFRKTPDVFVGPAAT